MKVVQRITLLLVIAFVLLFAAFGYARIQRELATHEEQVAEDLDIMGRTLSPALEEIRAAEGLPKALAVLERIDADMESNGFRWVHPASGEPDPTLGLLPPNLRARVERGERVTWVNRAEGERGRMVAYVPVTRPFGGTDGALEVSQPLSSEADLVRHALRLEALATTAAILGLGLLALVLGVWVVERPMQALVAQARRIGAGDLSQRVPVQRRDELGELAEEMNAMCDRLVRANDDARKAADARVTALEQLRHAERLTTVGKLTAGIAHELGTPLNVVLGRAKRIGSGKLTEGESTVEARIIGEQAQRMTAIIRQLLDFSRTGSPRTSKVDLRPLTSRCLSLLAPLARKKDVVLRLVEGGPSGEVLADPSQVEQVLANLIVNGVQAMKGGELTVAIEDDPRAGGPYVRLDVKDQGPGIDGEVLPHVFEPFFTTKDVGEGTGLGLSVAYGIVREHGGFIDVHTEPGVGSCFSVYLPRCPNREEPESSSSTTT